MTGFELSPVLNKPEVHYSSLVVKLVPELISKQTAINTIQYYFVVYLTLLNCTLAISAAFNALCRALRLSSLHSFVFSTGFATFLVHEHKHSKRRLLSLWGAHSPLSPPESAYAWSGVRGLRLLKLTVFLWSEYDQGVRICLFNRISTSFYYVFNKRGRRY
jgi:hypothetical protein